MSLSKCILSRRLSAAETLSAWQKVEELPPLAYTQQSCYCTLERDLLLLLVFSQRQISHPHAL